MGFFAVTGGRAQFFSRLGYGGNRSPESIEGNAEPRLFEAGRKQVAEKTSPGASELRKSPSSLKNRRYAKLALFAPHN